MAGEPSNADIMGAIGELTGQLKGVFRELDNASVSRKVLHEQIEAQGTSLKNVQFATEQQVQINAQTRDEIKALHQEQKAVKEEITPLLDMKDALPAMVETWRDMSKWSKRLVWVLGLGGVTTLGFFIWFGGIITEAVKHWLGIPTA